MPGFYSFGDVGAYVSIVIFCLLVILVSLVKVFSRVLNLYSQRKILAPYLQPYLPLPPFFLDSFQQHGASWWEELVRGTRPAPRSKCWDIRPSMRRLQGDSVNPGHKRGGPHSARELGEPRCCQVGAPPNDWQSWGLDRV